MIEIDIHPDTVVGRASPLIYGQMVEHAYWSVHLGLWGQVLDNGGFELDRDGGHPRVAQGWRLASTHAANEYSAEVDSDDPFNGSGCQRVAVTRYAGGEVRLSQCGLFLKADEDYLGSIHLRGRMAGAVCVEISSLAGEQLCARSLGPIDHAEWRRYDFSLRSDRESSGCSFALSIAGTGTLWVDQAQLCPAGSFRGHGTRADIVGLYQGLRPHFLRWPGGSYLMWHKWKNGIGSWEHRPYGHGRRIEYDMLHDGEWDPGSFGTDEFIQLCRDVGAEPMLNVTIKDGIQNALDWVEYCNGAAESTWGAVRAGGGHPDPYRVRYWVVDNEPKYAPERKGFEVAQYPRLAAEWARALKEKDPGIEVLVMGDHALSELIDRPASFTKEVARAARGAADHVCIHGYYGEDAHPPLQGMPYKLGECISGLARELGPGGPKVALTEWNPQSHASVAGNMGQALEAAQIFHVLERLSAEGSIDIATPCQLCVNVDRYRGRWLRSALVQIDGGRAWKSPMYLVNALYSESFEPNVLRVSCPSAPMRESRSFAGFRFPVLDITAARSDAGAAVAPWTAAARSAARVQARDGGCQRRQGWRTADQPGRGRLVIRAVNNHPDEPFETLLRIRGPVASERARVRQVLAPSLWAMNTREKPDEVTIHESEISIREAQIRLCLAPMSISVIEVIE